MMSTYMPEEVLLPERNREANSTTRRLSRIDLQRARTDVKRFVKACLETDFSLVQVSTCVEGKTLRSLLCY